MADPRGAHLGRVPCQPVPLRARDEVVDGLEFYEIAAAISGTQSLEIARGMGAFGGYDRNEEQ